MTPTWPAQIAGRYTLGERLGRGGMGEVFAAHDLVTDARVALKLVRREGASTLGVRRLLREALAAGRVDHPGVVRVYAAGEDAANDVAFVAQEFIPGTTLRAYLAQHPTLAPAQAATLVADVADALAAAHRAGVVHRDLKPENILLECPGDATRPRVIDFGIARLVEADNEDLARLTATGASLGTPAYMSPEQARGDASVDEQTDVWALGVVLYELLTGRSPFARPTPHATLAAVLLDAVPPPHACAPDVPEALSGVVLRALTRNRVDRFGSMEAFAEALRAATTPRTRPVPEAPPARRRPRTWMGAAALGLAALAGIVKLLAFSPPAPALDAAGPTDTAEAPAPQAPQAPQASPLRADTDAPPSPVTVARVDDTPPPASASLRARAGRAPRTAPRARTVPVASTLSPPRRVNGAPIVGL